MIDAAIDIFTPLVPTVFYKRIRPVVERTLFIVHKKKMMMLHSLFIKRGDLVFDVGAHEGYLTEIFLALGARVVSIEPQSRCVAVLEQKFSNNSKVIIVPKGLHDSETEMPLHISEKRPGIATFSDEWMTTLFVGQGYSRTIKVQTTTLDNLVDEFGKPSFCKIDIEGWELNALRGLTKKISAISFEFSFEFLDKAKQCCDCLKTLGAIRCNYSLDHDYLLQEKWMSENEMFEKLYGMKDLVRDILGDIYVMLE